MTIDIKIIIGDQEDNLFPDPNEYGHPDPDEHYGGPSALKFELYDGGTKRDPEDPENPDAWIDIPEWFSDEDPGLSSIWTWADPSGIFSGDGARIYSSYLTLPKDVSYTVSGVSDSKVSSSVLESEYGSGNPDRWVRKPVPLYDPDNEVVSGQGKWKMPAGEHFFYFELKKTKDGDPFAFFSPQQEKTGDAKNMKSVTGKDETIVKCTRKSKSYIKLKEIGTRSVAYYIDYQGSSLRRSFDWIEPSDHPHAGIYFSPFDTSDTDNIKVTKSPSYDATGTSGKFIESGTWQIYLMPRRIFYWMRWRRWVKTSDYLVKSFNTECTWSCIGTAQTPDNYDTYCEPGWAVNPGRLNWWEATSMLNTECAHDMCTITGWDGDPNPDGASNQIYDWSYERTRGTCTNCYCYSDGFTMFEYDCWGNFLGNQPEPHSCDCHGGACSTMNVIINESFSARFSKVDHYIGFWWGRLPHDFISGQSLISDWDNYKSTTALIVGVGNSSVNLSVRPTLAMWQQSYQDAGGTEEVANEMLVGCTSNDLHVTQYHTNLQMKMGAWHYSGGVCTYYDVDGEDPDVMRGTWAMWPVIGTQSVGIETSNQGMSAIWSKIESSNYFTNTISPMITSAKDNSDTSADFLSKIDCYPYGIGISPNMAGSLIAIVRKKGGSSFFIWRKTDETFNEMVVGSWRSYLGFETSSANGYSGTFNEGSPYEEDYVDQFQVESVGRKVTKIGRTPEIPGNNMECSWLKQATNVPIGGTGSVTLHAPVYVVASKERAIQDSDAWDDAPDTTYYNQGLKVRTGRRSGNLTSCDPSMRYGAKNKRNY